MILSRKSRTGPEDVAYKNDYSAFLTFDVISIIMSDNDYPLISCLLCKSRTFWNIFMIIGSLNPEVEGI